MDIKLISFTRLEKPVGSFIGIATVLLTDLGVRLNSIRVYTNKHRTWIHTPSAKIKRPDAVIEWVPNLCFDDTDTHTRFLDQLEETVLAYLESEGA